MNKEINKMIRTIRTTDCPQSPIFSKDRRIEGFALRAAILDAMSVKCT